MRNINSFLIIGTFFLLSSCNAAESNNSANSNLVAKKYFIKGMTCGGRIISVRTTLGRSKELNIVDKDVSVGEAMLKFAKKDYQENLTDCEVSNTIEKFTEYKVYTDKNHTQKACILKSAKS